MEHPTALVVDRDPAVRDALRAALESQGMMSQAMSSVDALEHVRAHKPDVLFLELDEPTAGETLAGMTGAHPGLVVVGLLGAESTDAAARALDAGAFDVLIKPLSPTALATLRTRVVAQRDLVAERDGFRDELRARAGYQGLVGRSAAMEALRERIERLASTDANVVFTGEAGVGKTLAARVLHGMSGRSESPFIAIDTPSFSAEGLENELFGSGDVGAFNGARGGTVYISAIDRVPGAIQDKLSDLLGRGGAVRLVASTSMPVAEAEEQGRLRPGLAEQLAGRVEVPPLRQRVEDIPLLTRHFIQSIRELNALPPIHLTPESLTMLEHHRWPGNARELRNAVEQAVILASGGMIHPRDLPDAIRSAEAPAAPAASGSDSSEIFKDAKRAVVEAFEKKYLTGLLERNRGNVTAAAQQAGMLRSALQRLLRKYSIRSAEFRRRPEA
ncbi:hypothetical protein ABI59_03865 [Acidobacteria bacterium Mor1]|nr:hypothetical protein ABI59_03865 [Acidobacteria bacterium Mor1]